MDPWGAGRARRRARRTRKQRNRGRVAEERWFPKSGGAKERGAGQTLNDLNRRAGLRNHHAPKCPWGETPRGDRSPPPRERGKARKPPYSAISMKTPVSAQEAEHLDNA